MSKKEKHFAHVHGKHNVAGQNKTILDLKCDLDTAAKNCMPVTEGNNFPNPEQQLPQDHKGNAHLYRQTLLEPFACGKDSLRCGKFKIPELVLHPIQKRVAEKGQCREGVWLSPTSSPGKHIHWQDLPTGNPTPGQIFTFHCPVQSHPLCVTSCPYIFLGKPNQGIKGSGGISTGRVENERTRSSFTGRLENCQISLEKGWDSSTRKPLPSSTTELTCC